MTRTELADAGRAPAEESSLSDAWAELCETCLAPVRATLLGSVHPVEREIGSLISIHLDQGAMDARLQRYLRKVDVTRRVVTAYDAALERALTQQPVGSSAYLGLAFAFSAAALRSPGDAEGARAYRLRWINSAMNAIELAGGPTRTVTHARLVSWLDEVLHAAICQ